MVGQEQGYARLGMWLVIAPPQIVTLNVAFLLSTLLLLLLFPTSFLLFVLSALGITCAPNLRPF